MRSYSWVSIFSVPADLTSMAMRWSLSYQLLDVCFYLECAQVQSMVFSPPGSVVLYRIGLCHNADPLVSRKHSSRVPSRSPLLLKVVPCSDVSLTEERAYCITWTLTAYQRRMKAMEMRCYRCLMHISYKKHITIAIVCNKIHATIEKRKLRLFGYAVRPSGLCKQILQGTRGNGKRKAK